MAFGLVSGCRVWVRSELAEKPKRPGLVALLSPLAGEVERVHRGRTGLVETAGRKQRLAHAELGQHLERPQVKLLDGDPCLLQPIEEGPLLPFQDRERTQFQRHRGQQGANRQLLREGARLAQERSGLCGCAPQGMNASDVEACDGQAVRVTDLLGQLDRGSAVADGLIEHATLAQGPRELR